MTVPALALVNFQYKRYIDNLTEEEFDEAKDFVTTKWYGVFEMWEVLPQDVKFKKREVIFSLLIMWYLADMYPTRLVGGVMGQGGMPLSAKSIKSIQLQFRKLNMPEGYDELATNQFGIKAASMIRSAPEMMGVYGA